MYKSKYVYSLCFNFQLDKLLQDILLMVVYSCKKCSELNNLNPHAFWDITDFGAKCEKCEMINTITLENGELKKTGVGLPFCDYFVIPGFVP
jgi:hypothetical protein